MEIPGPDYHVFGMGSREKLLYRGGALVDLASGEETRRWEVSSERFEPGEYCVVLETQAGEVVIGEDAEAMWIEEEGEREVLSAAPVRLPDFEGGPHADVLRALHAEILVNVLPAGPVPCLLVYDRPWYRDTAMMCMVLEQTGNLDLVAPWIDSLREPFDTNNAGNREPDNLGELLYMISLVGDRSHPLVDVVLAAAKDFGRDGHICGLTDGSEHPVYQTKWMKYGLRALGLEDPYEIPDVADSYSALFWMDWRDQHVECESFGERSRELYPYLAWAEAHFHGAPAPMGLSGRGDPLTWEARASEARYDRMAVVSPEHARERISLPHTWHAAEMFLYLVEDPEISGTD